MVVGANKPSVVRKGRALHIKHFCVHNAIAILFHSAYPNFPGVAQSSRDML